MKIEKKLLLKNMKKNIKRITFTTISIALCSFFIFASILIISSVRKSVLENTDNQYNDYFFSIKDITSEDFNKIKDKEYIDKIYVQENNDSQLKIVNNIYSPSGNLNVYIKYVDIKDTYKNSSNIVQTLNFSYNDAEEKCNFNEDLLIIYGLVGSKIDDSKGYVVFLSMLNYSYVINIMIVLVLAVFSILFIVILYNAFLISINERKKEYAILNSIGATEGQILKMVFLEATIMGIVGVIIGFLLSILGANIILNILNNILESTKYHFNVVFDFKYIIIALIIILFNIYISAIIPSVKASSTSVIQNLKNNKQIKYKKRNKFLNKILPIEGRLALINLKRNKNKYRIITILFVICMTSYITVNTYISYEKEASGLIMEYDVDAELFVDVGTPIDHKTLLDNYSTYYNDNIEYIEYKITGITVGVEPEDAINYEYKLYRDTTSMVDLALIGLDDKTYQKYINDLNVSYGDYIIYNVNTEIDLIDEYNILYTFFSVFNTNELQMTIMNPIYYYENNSWEYDFVDNEILNGSFVLTDELIEGFKEVKTVHGSPTIFLDMNTYNNINKKINDYEIQENEEFSSFYTITQGEERERLGIKIKCENIIKFSNYIENIKEFNNTDILCNYYSLDEQEKLIFINVIQLILNIIIFTIIIIGIISATNIINASLCEREQEFKILSDVGATNVNINKILIYEAIYMFIKALVISIILSILIIYLIIQNMESVLVLHKLLIPFENIGLFLLVMFILSICITLFSSKSIKK